jgi:hypothetical protein
MNEYTTFENDGEKEKEKTKNKTCCGYVSEVTHKHLFI